MDGSSPVSFLAFFISSNLTRIIAIVVLFFFGKIILSSLVKKLLTLVRVSGQIKKYDPEKLEKRITLLHGILMTMGNAVILIIVFIMLLELFGVSIGPILAGAGVLGFAVGFGAQTLVKDLISGLFILIEDQFSLGDNIKAAGFEGKVVGMTMRLTILEDEEGSAYYLSNGSLANIVNLSRRK